MKPSPFTSVEPLHLDCFGLDRLIEHLRQLGYTVIAPTIRDGAIVLEPIENAQELPIGWSDVQDAGHYQLVRRRDDARFGYCAGPQAWKRHLHPPQLNLWQAKRHAHGFDIVEHEHAPRHQAFLGVKSCDLAAIRVHDRVFTGGDEGTGATNGAPRDPTYTDRRQDTLLIATACTQPAANCFCASLETGPAPAVGFDLALTEIIGDSEHYFVVTIGSSLGAEVIAPLELARAQPSQVDAARLAVERAAQQMGRTLDVDGLKDMLARNLESPHWEDVARRCLACTNCTMVCPTCFCTTVEDHTTLGGDVAERVRRWDSCFTAEFSYIHGGSVRLSTLSRYRQWLTHKFSSWFDQFGTGGCVGCGRCITWCPVGIDLRQEIRAIRQLETETRPSGGAKEWRHGKDRKA